jgi:hypothetical protein
MPVKRRTLLFVVLALLVWALVASLIGAYYYMSYSDLFQKTRKPVIHVNLGFNYANGTVQWFNQTEARGGDALIDVTMKLAEVNCTETNYVTSINNVNNAGLKGWTWWTWIDQVGWDLKLFGSDKYVLGDNETITWYYADGSTWPPSPPS